MMMIWSNTRFAAVLLCCCPVAFVSAQDEAPEAPVEKIEPLPWRTDYLEALSEARDENKLLFLFFHHGPEDRSRRAFETLTLVDSHVRELLRDFVVAKTPVDAKINVDGEEIPLLQHKAFQAMQGRQGIAIVDMKHEGTEYYGRMVSAFPFSPGHYYSAAPTRVILELPAGTLTQRTMVYAVRTHPETPASTNGNWNSFLAGQAQEHSNHQAQTRIQGHQGFMERFHRIQANLRGGPSASEVVAESWEGQTLVEAAKECVRSWRQSPSHWGAVRSFQEYFGYDMKKGPDGVWYATGIFAND
ncbi:MAG: hypothetical protein N2C14_25870 [Planctomycetales bacterium]